MAYAFNDNKTKAAVYTTSETYGKSEVWSKSEAYSKSQADSALTAALQNYYPKSNVYTKTEVNDIYATKSELDDYQTKTNGIIPIGGILPFAGSTAPSGYFFCRGGNVSRTTYSELFAVIGTTYGAGDGSTTFTLPDLRGRFPLGYSSSYSLGSKGGAATVTLSVDQMPSHNHRVQDDWGNALTWSYGQYSEQSDSRWGPWWGDGYGGSGQAQTTWVGGGQPHENMPPYVTVDYIIRAK